MVFDNNFLSKLKKILSSIFGITVGLESKEIFLPIKVHTLSLPQMFYLFVYIETVKLCRQTDLELGSSGWP